MPLAAKFSWSAISDTQLEDLVYDILDASHPVRIAWRTGPGGQGRDVEAVFERGDALGQRVSERFFAEAKHYAGGVSPIDLQPALAWAQAEVPQVLIFAVSSHLTNPARDLIDKWSSNNPRTRVTVWERKDIENRVLGSEELRAKAVAMGLLPADVRALVPADPSKLRKGSDEFELAWEYRYWITQDEITKVGRVIDTIATLALCLEKEAPNKYFELVALATSNWTTFLELLQAQLALQIAVRDYLLEQVGGGHDLASLADKVRAAAAKVAAIGDSALYAD